MGKPPEAEKSFWSKKRVWQRLPFLRIFDFLRFGLVSRGAHRRVIRLGLEGELFAGGGKASLKRQEPLAASRKNFSQY